MIKIFDSTDTSFNTNGNIVIEPLKLNEVKKKSLNGWYIEVEIPIKYKDYIEQDKLCVVKTKSKLRPQAFRIGNVEYSQRKIIFTAEHVMFDARNYFLLDVRPTNLNGLNALKYINERTDKTSPFSIIASDIEHQDTCYFIRKNLLEAWAIIEERYNGVFDADNFDISFNLTIGIDRGETIIYGKNLQNIKVFEDWSNVCTRIYPVGKDGLMLEDKFIDSEIQYERPYTKTISFETELEENEQTEENLLIELKEKAIDYLENNQVPLVSYEINSDINQLMEIGDKIHVKHPIVNILTEVLEYEYNGIAKKVKKIVFGNYTRDVKVKFDNIKNSIENIKIEVSNQTQIINKQTDLINSLNKNGYVYIDDNEILILDALPISSAKNVWRFGLGGIGFSSNGYKGPFNIAMTSDGRINADFILTGTLSADRIEGYKELLLNVSSINTQIIPTSKESGSNIHIEEASDKKMVNFEIEGKSTQKTRSGKNLLPINSGNYTINNYYYVDKNTGILITNDMVGKKISFSAKITISNITTSGTAIFFVLGIGTSSTGGMTKQIKVTSYGATSGTYTPKIENVEVTSDMVGNYFVVRYAGFSTPSTTTIQYSEAQLEFSSTATEYEPYGVMPSPDYPSEIESVGYRNLFDISKISENTYISSGDGTTGTSSVSNLSDYIPVKKGENYVISFKYDSLMASNKRGLVIYNTNKAYVSGIAISPSSPTTVYISQDGYIRFTYDKSWQDIIVAKGTQQHSYIPYGKYGIEVKNTGKNQLPNNLISQILNGVTATVNDDKSITLNGTATSNGWLTIATNLSLPANNYNLSLKNKISGFGLYLGSDSNTDYAITQSTNNEIKKFSLSNSTTFDVVRLRIINGTVFDNLTVYPMLTISNDSTYEPYQENTSLFVLDQPLRSLPNGVKDIAYIKNNILYVDRKVGSVVLDGSDNFSINKSNNDYISFYITSNLAKNLNKYNRMSDNFTTAIWIGEAENLTKECYWQHNVASMGFVILKSRLATPDVAGFKSWLSTHNTQVDYELAEPYTEKIGEVEIPSTFKGVNNIITTDELEPVMNIEYVRDTILSDYVEGQVNSSQVTLRNEMNAKFVLQQENIDLELSKKVNDNEIIASINMSTEKMEDGSSMQIQADKLNLKGKKFNLTTDEMTIESENFSVSKEGKISAKSGEIGGFEIETDKFSNLISETYNFTENDYTKVRNYIMETEDLTDEEIELYDINGDGKVSASDYVRIKNMVDGLISNIINGTLEINSKSSKRTIVLRDSEGKIVTALGLNGSTTPSFSCDEFYIGSEKQPSIQSGTSLPTEVKDGVVFLLYDE